MGIHDAGVIAFLCPKETLFPQFDWLRRVVHFCLETLPDNWASIRDIHITFCINFNYVNFTFGCVSFASDANKNV